MELTLRDTRGDPITDAVVRCTSEIDTSGSVGSSAGIYPCGTSGGTYAVFIHWRGALVDRRQVAVPLQPGGNDFSCRFPQTVRLTIVLDAPAGDGGIALDARTDGDAGS